MTDPRLLLLDFTAIPGPAATSTLKAAYFNGWAEGALLHVMDLGRAHLGLAAGPAYEPHPFPIAGLSPAQFAEAFNPQIILYRPVADSEPFHRYAMASIGDCMARGAGLAVWIMDDWPERLRTSDPARFKQMDSDLRYLFARSSVNFAISSGMAEAFRERYGADFRVAHNGVNPADWPATKRSRRNHAVIRYAGSLAPDTTRESVAATAKAVSNLNKRGIPIRLEGRTQKAWMAQAGKALNALKGVSFSPSTFDDISYRRWLSEADILLIAYNFDEATRAYLKYSFANKIPETMAAGAAILAYGPKDLETVAFLHRTGAAMMVTEPDEKALEDAIEQLATNAAMREALGAAARGYAFQHFDLTPMKSAFRDALADAASPTLASESAGPNATDIVENIAGPLAPKSTYRRIADAVTDRMPGVSAALRPLTQRVRLLFTRRSKRR